MRLHHASDLLHRGKARPHAPAVPLAVQAFGGALVLAVPQLAEQLLHRPGTARLEVRTLEKGEFHSSRAGHVLLAVEPELLRADERGVSLRRQLTTLAAPDE